MTTSEPAFSRRRALKVLGTSTLALAALAIIRSSSAWAQTTATSDEPPILMDGHVHVINRIYWEKIDQWQPPAYEAGWDYGRARAGGVNCIVDNIGTTDTGTTTTRPNSSCA